MGARQCANRYKSNEYRVWHAFSLHAIGRCLPLPRGPLANQGPAEAAALAQLRFAKFVDRIIPDNGPWFNDVPYLTYRKLHHVPLPSPSELQVFIDNSERTIGGGLYSFYPKDSGLWGKLPADRHGHGGVVSHADGSAELRQWRWQKSNRDEGDKVLNKADLSDFQFMTLGRPRERDYVPAWWDSMH